MYLVDRSRINHPAYPNDESVKAKIQEILDLDEQFLKPPLNCILHAVLVSNLIELSNKVIVSLQESYNCLERRLQDSQYLTGDSLTIADLSCLATVSTATVFTPICSARHPKLFQWFSTCKKLPYYKEANSNGLAKLDLLVEDVLGRRI
nr:glutathione S-transferase D4-like [Onthophagus taurus]